MSKQSGWVGVLVVSDPDPPASTSSSGASHPPFFFSFHFLHTTSGQVSHASGPLAVDSWQKRHIDDPPRHPGPSTPFVQDASQNQSRAQKCHQLNLSIFALLRVRV